MYFLAALGKRYAFSVILPVSGSSDLTMQQYAGGRSQLIDAANPSSIENGVISSVAFHLDTSSIRLSKESLLALINSFVDNEQVGFDYAH